jgi:tetratricopeptide (TPR) repeat protein
MRQVIASLLLAAAALCGGELSPAERAIAAARLAIEKNPGKAEHHNALALALARRARETADPEFYEQALAALEKSFAIEKDNFEGRKIMAWVMLGRHEFAEALKLVKELNRKTPDDTMVYGMLADAHAELGNYKEAEEATQWLLNIGRSSVPGLTRAAHLRELFGDLEGALELMNTAFHRISPREAEERAWVLTHAAHLHLLAGRPQSAGPMLEEALRLFPNYHYALAKLAKVRALEGRHADAAELFRRRYDAAPHPENLYDLAAALDKAGRKQEAREAFAEFEKKARAEMKSWDNSNRELIFYYANYSNRPDEALKVAQLEAGRRQDVYTLDAYAWALFKNGKHAEARRQINRALAVGVKDPEVLERAKAIGK